MRPTPAQLAILEKIIGGRSLKEAAYALGISEQTGKNQMWLLRSRLGLSSSGNTRGQVDILGAGLRAGWLEVTPRCEMRVVEEW